ncbi:MAG: ORC1-type DNA replication protein [Thermoplasmataceae archaeon]
MANPFLNLKKDNPILIGDLSSLGVSFVPGNLPHREKEIEQLTSLLGSLMRGSRPSNIMLYGKTGTGKTSTARYVASMLLEASGDKNSVAYINCQIFDSPYSILVSIVQSIGGDGEQIPPMGWPLDRIYSELLKRLKLMNKNIIIILDEIDKLTEKNGGDSLYVILKMCEDSPFPFVSIIGITNNTNFVQELDSRVSSRLGQESIMFNPYNASELRDILKFRTQSVVKDQVLEDSAINLCAAIGAQEHGDARKALDLMRIAIDITIRENKEKVTEAEVNKAREKLETDLLKESVNGLPLHSKIVLLSTVVTQEMDKRPMFSGEIYENYRNICSELGFSPLTSRRVSDIVSDLDDNGLIITRIKSMGRHGRTRLIQVPENNGRIKQYILEDESLESFRGTGMGKQSRFYPFDGSQEEASDKNTSMNEDIDDVFDAKPEDL